jgi:uncharacterized membrane protein
VAEQAAAGERSPLSPREHRRVERAVALAERVTGLEFCVYLGMSGDDSRAHAEAVFAEAGLHERPAVLILVAPLQRRVEVVTSPAVMHRVSDRDCGLAVMGMVSSFAVGDIAGGICDGLRRLAEAAGTGTAPAGAERLPDVLG